VNGSVWLFRAALVEMGTEKAILPVYDAGLPAMGIAVRIHGTERIKKYLTKPVHFS
jgi:hypothetical protein